MRAYVRACVRACMSACVRVCPCACVRVDVQLTYDDGVTYRFVNRIFTRKAIDAVAK